MRYFIRLCCAVFVWFQFALLSTRLKVPEPENKISDINFQFYFLFFTTLLSSFNICENVTGEVTFLNYFSCSSLYPTRGNLSYGVHASQCRGSLFPRATRVSSPSNGIPETRERVPRRTGLLVGEHVRMHRVLHRGPVYKVGEGNVDVTGSHSELAREIM